MDDKKATPDDYITGLKNAVRFHQSQVDKYNLAIHAFEEGYKAGGKAANGNARLEANQKHDGD
jgi:hypothetical protein